MPTFDFKSSNIPGYGLGVDFGSMDRTGTFYGQQPITTPGKYAFMNDPGYKSATPELQKIIAEKELGNSSFGDVLKMVNMFKPTRAEKQADLKDAATFQQEQMLAAAPYNMVYGALNTLSKLPEQISGRAADRAMNIVLGARNATEAYNLAAASYPRTNFQSTASPVQRNYFT